MVFERGNSSSTLKASADVTNGNGNGNGNGYVDGEAPANTNHRLQLCPNQNHMSENYDDLDTEFNPLIFSSLERYLPPNLLDAPRETKYEYMRGILCGFSTEGERNRQVQTHNEYRQKIISNYRPLCRELYTMNPSMFFVESFLRAFNANEKYRDEYIRDILSKIAPGVYTFQMLHPSFCEMLLREVKNIEEWLHETKLMVMLPSTITKSGLVLNDFGMKGTLDKLLENFVCHISRILFPDVCSLDSQHGYVVQYGIDRDVEAGFHMDDSEVTLNVCLGKEFTGGELFFGGMRCEQHVNSEPCPKEICVYSHKPGHAIIHRGYNRHGAKAITSGHRINLVMWCRSSVSRELKRHRNNFANFCGKCQGEKEKKLQEMKRALFARERGAPS
ncbi:hypothetical protein SSX86_027706 [Deinandra increscens subsp. villosa]|uniref:Fe2OG dioxygenase domain-containing protein n=1 Tax=Deinandra increscens subsp. villosa TaxID=3103831 RepID=A0AAP0CBR1_9ASTR